MFVERLKHEPMSRFRAEVLGSDENIGFGIDQYMLAAQIDYLNMNTSVTAAHGSKKKPKVPDPFWRPDQQDHTAAPTIDELPIAQLAAMIH